MLNRIVLRFAAPWLLFAAVFGAVLVTAQRLFHADYPTARLIAMLALIPAGLIYFGLQDTSIRRAERRVRQLALSKGLEVEQRTRHITAYDADPKAYEEGAVFGYFVRHRFPRSSTWRLLMPQSGQGDFPNGWKLIVREGEVSAGIRRRIAETASELSRAKGPANRFAEVECDADRTWAYLDETAGLKAAGKIFDLILRVAEEAD